VPARQQARRSKKEKDMPEYLSPGVYVEEIELGPRPIEGVSTSTAGFLGETLRGPEEPRFITGFEEFSRLYGGHVPVDQSTLPFAIDGFFKNGGQRCFVGRITAPDADFTTKDHDTKIRIRAIGPGEWGNRIAAKIEPATLQVVGELARFKLTVMYWDVKVAPPTDPPVDPTLASTITNVNRREPTILEVYDNLSVVSTSIDFFETTINGSSSLIRVDHIDAVIPPTAIADMLPLAMLPTNGTAGDNGAAVVRGDYVGRTKDTFPDDDTSYKTGLAGFEQIDEIAIVVAPDYHKIDTNFEDIIAHCAKMRDRFAITHSDPRTDTLATVAAIDPPPDTTFAAFYTPWIKVYNPLTYQDSLVSPSGHIAGIYAKTDVERGVFKAPANEVVVGARSLQFQITKQNQDILNPKGVNCIRAFPGRGLRLWGARTCSRNTLWKYVNVRRYFLYVGESIDEGTQWVVFEPNDERLWARVNQTITQFLITEWRNGALMGTKPSEAFFVKVDRTTMTQNDIDNGRLICIIGLAAVKPAEFVIFRLTQFQGGSEITEI
jgi:phage tail sheath protein FI